MKLHPPPAVSVTAKSARVCHAGARKRRRKFHTYNRRVAKAQGEKLIAENRRARHEYQLLERVEAGLALAGSEVKSLRQGHSILQRAYADARDGELWLVGLHIPPYEQASVTPHDPDRDRKLLLHRRQIDQLTSKVAERGLTLVPMRIYFTRGMAKMELGLGRGKRRYEKRGAIAERESRREAERVLAARQRGER